MWLLIFYILRARTNVWVAILIAGVMGTELHHHFFTLCALRICRLLPRKSMTSLSRSSNIRNDRRNILHKFISIDRCADIALSSILMKKKSTKWPGKHYVKFEAIFSFLAFFMSTNFHFSPSLFHAFVARRPPAALVNLCLRLTGNGAERKEPQKDVKM